MSRFCDYSETPPNPTVEDLTALKGRLAELESKLQDVTRHSSTSCASTSTSISPPAEAFFHDQCPPVFPQVETWARGLHDFDPTMFLDATLFREAGLPVTRPVVEIPQVSCANIICASNGLIVSFCSLWCSFRQWELKSLTCHTGCLAMSCGYRATSTVADGLLYRCTSLVSRGPQKEVKHRLPLVG